MFEALTPAPPDAILGLTEAFKRDTNPRKVNLTVGVYQDAEGSTPMLRCIRAAEQKLIAVEKNKGYLGIAGMPEYTTAVRELLFGVNHPVLADQRAATVQTPGGTGGLRVAGDFVRNKFAQATVWCSNPTWANHPNIFRAAGLPVEMYPYLDAAGTGLDFEAMAERLADVPAGDVVCLHGCCHNPTGVDLTPDQWQVVARIAAERGWLPLIDIAYQGFGDGIGEDAASLKALAEQGVELLICSSYSKNFGLYGERVGALTVVADSASAAEAVLSHLKASVRANYSNPPRHGAGLVATVLADPALRADWELELGEMRERILSTRQAFVQAMKDSCPNHDFSFINRQRGMFSYSGLNSMQVDQLRNEYSIYIVGSGRINVAGINDANLEYVVSSIAAVL